MGETTGVAFLLTPWLVAIKYPKQIPLCDTNTVALLIIVIIIDKEFLPISKKNQVGLLTQKNSKWWVGQNLILWGKKAIAEIAIYLSCRVW